MSFYVLLATIFLLPVFFIPGGALSMGAAKSALLILGVALGMLLYVYELWRGGKFIMPKHPIIIVAVALPLVYLLSALIATPSSLSLFGYNFEAGTFGFILLGSALLLLVSSVFVDSSRILQAFSAFLISFAILAIITGLKVFFGFSMWLGASNIGNPLGNWTDLSMAFGLLALLSALTVGMIPMKALARSVLYVAFFLSTALFAVLSFQASFALVLAEA